MLNAVLSMVPNSPVDITEKRGEPGKNSKKAEFGIIESKFFIE